MDPLDQRGFVRRLGLSPEALVAVLFVITAVPRMWGVFTHAQVLELSGLAILWTFPFLFLTREGRRQSGLKRPQPTRWLAYAVVVGALFAVVGFGVGWLAFGRSSSNWSTTLLDRYLRSPGARTIPVAIMFAITTVPVVFVSPISEELFFRGMMQRALSPRFGVRTAAVLNSLAFAIVHIAYHGLDLVPRLQFLALPSVLWFGLMFAVSLAFTWLRLRSDSVWPAVVGHATYNVAMNVGIWFLLFE